MTASYIKVAWKHEHRDEPVLLYSELDGERWEIRKVELFRDGSMAHADEYMADGSMLGLIPVPSMVEIASQPEFAPALIARDEFEDIWSRATRASA